MFATKGWMKATICIVGVLAVSFGLYIIFSINDVMGHGLDDHDTRETTHKAIFSDITNIIVQ